MTNTHDTQAPPPGSQSLGREIRSEFGPTHVIGDVEKSAAGNTVLRVGEHDWTDGGWVQIAHVVLTPAEREALIARLIAQRIFGKEVWEAALDMAYESDWCPIDSRENPGGSELAGFIAEQYENHDTVDRDEYRLRAAIDAAAQQFPEWGIEEFQEVIASYLNSHLYGPVSGGEPANIEVHDKNMDITYRFKRIRP